jgi:hypothetical protein
LEKASPSHISSVRGLDFCQEEEVEEVVGGKKGEVMFISWYHMVFLHFREILISLAVGRTESKSGSHLKC